MTKEKVVKCYFCWNIVDEEQVVEERIQIGNKKYRRQFHSRCLPDYLERGERLPKPKVTKPQKLDLNKIHKCYYCDKVIDDINDIAWKKYPIATRAGRQWKNRALHVECLLKYNEEINDINLRQEENDDWDKVYKYFRKEILGLPETVPLQEHEIKRLLGLRLGQYYPRSTNTRILPRGYEYKTILVTLKVAKPKLVSYLSSTNFTNHKHRIDGIMRFVTGEINDVQKRMDFQKKSNEKLKQDTVQPVNGDYISHLKRKEDKKKVRDSSDLDLGGLL